MTIAKTLAAALAAAAVGAAGAAGAGTVLADLKVGERDAKALVASAVEWGGAPVGPAAKAFRAASPAARVTLARGGVAWVRAYLASPEWAAEYAGMRERHRPVPPKDQGSPEDRLAALEETQQRSVAELRRAAESAQPQLRDALAKAAAAGEAQLAAQRVDPARRKLHLDAFAMEAAEAARRHAEAVRAFDESWPADARPAVAARLRRLLEACADVDFGAKLVRDGDRMVFADPAHERRPALWKLCYRAGKEPVAAARAAAQAWLAELERR